MHPEAREWVAAHAPTAPVSVLEVGSLDVNGSVRDLFPHATSYVGIDVRPGRHVDVVADGRTYEHEHLVDVIVCTEVLEHAQPWEQIISTCQANLRSGGKLIVTCAGSGRTPHGCQGLALPADEYYSNVDPLRLLAELLRPGWTDATVSVLGTDLRAVATRA